ncbi:kinase-like protein [Cenococcum geophilum 1.58]|uniref:kinase-like protein n=1 Tax=Cenococcum geophilum 1.58 TaxID=794803 RepID=UPI00358EC319|nr:kinase-like protein [Cenococcum geophilum 1.58]
MFAWFPGNGSNPTQRSLSEQLSETHLRGISDVLRFNGREQWSRIPRIYSILRLIDQLPTIDIFLAQGITDYWFPFEHKTLPSSLSPSAMDLFLRTQHLVLTKSLDLERETGQHKHFSHSDDVPFIKVAELGQGGYGYVDKVVSTVSYKEYARKLIPRTRTFKKDRKVLKEFEHELAHLKKLKHGHIVQFIGSYTDPRFVSIIMSPVADCNLKEYLEVESIGSVERVSERRSFLRTFFGCLTSALCYLHENCVRHKDIKPQNVLVKTNAVFLTDFGISFDWTEVGKSTTSGDTIRTLRYCAPEVAKFLPRNSSSDMWSLGCVFLEIWTVLKEESVSRLYTHLEGPGSVLSHYYLNPSGVSSWLSILGSKGLNSDNAPRSWISNLMQEDQKARWTAHMLLEAIVEVNSDPETKYIFSGLCCIDDLESAESVHSWASVIDLAQPLDSVSFQEPMDNVQLESAITSESSPEPLVGTSVGMPPRSSSDNP